MSDIIITTEAIYDTESFGSLMADNIDPKYDLSEVLYSYCMSLTVKKRKIAVEQIIETLGIINNKETT